MQSNRLLRDQPALGVIYNVGGGNMGLVEALRAAGRASDMLVVGHEVNPVTTPLLRAGAMDFAIAGDPANSAVQRAGSGRRSRSGQIRGPSGIWSSGIYTRFNLPGFGAA